MKVEDYILKNNKATYYRVKEDLNVEYIEPSFVFEMIYFNNEELLNKELNLVVKEKEKKISRCANLDIKEISSRLFRSIVNKDKYHTVSLANELYLRDKDKLFEILYKLSFLSEDENKLIKTYLFELMDKKNGYNPYILKNLIIYFIKSYSKYMDMGDKIQIEYFSKNVTKLYEFVYNVNANKRKNLGFEKLNLESRKEMSELKKYIFNRLEREEL